MLAGRFLLGFPILALAGSLAAKARAAPSAGTFPTHGPLFRRPAGRGHPHRRAADLFSGARAGPDRRALRHARGQDVLTRSSDRTQVDERSFPVARTITANVALAAPLA